MTPDEHDKLEQIHKRLDLVNASINALTYEIHGNGKYGLAQKVNMMWLVGLWIVRLLGSALLLGIAAAVLAILAHGR